MPDWESETSYHRRRVSRTIALLKHIYAPSCSAFSSFQCLAVDKEVLDWQEGVQRLKRWEGRRLPGLNLVALISCTLAAGRRWTRVDWLSSCVSGAQTGSTRDSVLAAGKDAGTGYQMNTESGPDRRRTPIERREAFRCWPVIQTRRLWKYGSRDLPTKWTDAQLLVAYVS